MKSNDSDQLEITPIPRVFVREMRYLIFLEVVTYWMGSLISAFLVISNWIDALVKSKLLPLFSVSSRYRFFFLLETGSVITYRAPSLDTLKYGTLNRSNPALPIQITEIQNLNQVKPRTSQTFGIKKKLLSYLQNMESLIKPNTAFSFGS